ncbi:DUF2917 domain-containing protein [Luteolibacter soli]|uniref:DUF2917 domain-containing protein n=1 Tax=Luteolibacter soli TaxID=3135280 RepID=A0ABU9AQM6_9BACT
MKISLTRREVESLDLSSDDRLRLTTRNGSAWVTLSGTAEDFILTSSSPVELAGPGRLVIEALDGDIVVHLGFSRTIAGNAVLIAAS